ncbi:hypothetical protein NUSPORA_01386 [Nucleospora cyclopteri]
MKNTKTYSLFNKISYTLICTIGSGVLIGPQILRKDAEYNIVVINVALIIVTLISQLLAQGYAELKRIIPEKGGDFLYIDLAFSRTVGTIYSLVMLLILVPSCNSFFCSHFSSLLNLQGRNKLIFIIIMLAALTIFALLPIKKRIVALKILSNLQNSALIALSFLIPLAYYKSDSNPKISQTGNCNVSSFSLKNLLRTISAAYFYFSGYYECNGLPANVVGDLSIAYLIALFMIYATYAYFVNWILLLYQNEPRPVDLKDILGFIPNYNFTYVISRLIQFCIYIPPLCGNMFCCNNNLSFVSDRLKLSKVNSNLLLSAVPLLSLFFLFLEDNEILRVVDFLFFFATLLSMVSIPVLSKRKERQGEKINRKFPNSVAYFAAVSCFLLCSINFYFFIDSF